MPRPDVWFERDLDVEGGQGVIFTPDPEGRLRTSRHRYVDGSPLSTEELPSMRALRGEVVKSDYLVRDPRTNDDRLRLHTPRPAEKMR